MGLGSLFGSTPSYSVEKTPTKQETKSLSAGATAAADAQRERARKNRGVSASIMTNRSGSGGLSSNTQGNSTLG